MPAMRQAAGTVAIGVAERALARARRMHRAAAMSDLRWAGVIATMWIARVALKAADAAPLPSRKQAR